MPREQERFEVDKPAAGSRRRGSGRRAPAKKSVEVRRAPRARPPERGLERLERVVGEPLAARTRDREHGTGRHAVARGGREHRRGREVEGERAGSGPGGREHRIVDVGRRDEPARGVGPRRAAARQRVRQRDVRIHPLAGAERAARAVGGQRRVDDDERSQRRGAEAGGRADADEPARAERDELGDDGGGARAAEAGALDRQRLAVGGEPAVAPQPAVVVEHPRRVDQLIRQSQRAAGIAREQDALGDGLVRLEDHGCVRHVVAHSS